MPNCEATNRPCLIKIGTSNCSLVHVFRTLLARVRRTRGREKRKKEKKRKNRRALEDATMICQMIYQVSYHLPRNVIVRLAWARLTSLFRINAARMHCRGANLLRSCFELIWWLSFYYTRIDIVSSFFLLSLSNRERSKILLLKKCCEA